MKDINQDFSVVPRKTYMCGRQYWKAVFFPQQGGWIFKQENCLSNIYVLTVNYNRRLVPEKSTSIACLNNFPEQGENMGKRFINFAFCTMWKMGINIAEKPKWRKIQFMMVYMELNDIPTAKKGWGFFWYFLVGKISTNDLQRGWKSPWILSLIH